MNIYSEIRKKPYVAPRFLCEEMEEQELLAGTGTSAAGQTQEGQGGWGDEPSPAKAFTGDFVFDSDEEVMDDEDDGM